MTPWKPIPPDVLACIVTGWAKGGTSLTAWLLADTIRASRPFEGAVLLAESPARGYPEPYRTHADAEVGLPADFDLRYRACADHAAAYRYLRTLDPDPGLRGRPFLDKTPAYLPSLPVVVERAPGTPILIIQRDPELVVRSWIRGGYSLPDAIEGFLTFLAGLVALARGPLPSGTIEIVRLDDIVADPVRTIRGLLPRLGLDPGPPDPGSPIGGLGRDWPSRILRSQERAPLPGGRAVEEEIEIALARAFPQHEEVRALAGGPFAGVAERIAGWDVGTRDRTAPRFFTR